MAHWVGHDHSKNMAVLVRKSATMPALKIIYDASHPDSRYFDYDDDPSASCEETVAWFLIAEVSFRLKTVKKTKEETPAPGAAPAAEETPGTAPAAGPSQSSAVEKGSVQTYSADRRNRAGLERCKVVVLHMDHNNAREKIGKSKLRLRQIAWDMARYQVDFVGGDLNNCAYKAKKHHFRMNPWEARRRAHAQGHYSLH